MAGGGSAAGAAPRPAARIRLPHAGTGGPTPALLPAIAVWLVGSPTLAIVWYGVSRLAYVGFLCGALLHTEAADGRRAYDGLRDRSQDIADPLAIVEGWLLGQAGGFDDFGQHTLRQSGWIRRQRGHGHRRDAKTRHQRDRRRDDAQAVPAGQCFEALPGV